MYAVHVCEHADRLLRVLGDNRWSADRLAREAMRSGVPLPLLAQAVDCLTTSGLVMTREDSSVSATELGLIVVAARRLGDFRPLVLALLKSMPHQVTALLDQAARGDLGLHVPIDVARKRAPQAASLVGWLGDVHAQGDILVLPEELITGPLAAEVGPSIPDWVEDRVAVGARAEQYTLVFERSRSAPKSVLHVAAESDRYGYDVENASGSAVRCIEVKGSRGKRVRFELSSHELRVAERRGAAYEIYFWGGIDLNRRMEDEYVLLTGEGYPLRLVDPAALISGGELVAEPASWTITARPVSRED